MKTEKLYQHFLKSSGVSTDTRKIEKGQIYFALSGENFDGNKFTEQALEKGASLAVIDHSDYQNEDTFLVENVLKTLQDLARFHREKLEIPIIGLTGSNGKTTTKELMAAVLSAKFKTASTEGNLNNHIGVPLTLLKIKPEHKMAVVEMGANHQKEIEFLCGICRPDFGYITNFGKAHLEGFGGLEGVIKGKSELYDFLRKNDGKVFLNKNDAIQIDKSRGIENFTFGNEKSADVSIKIIENQKETLSVEFDGIEIHSNLTGNYNFSNLAAAISIGQYFEIPNEKIKGAIENYHPKNQRSQIQKTENNLLILDTYNANPSSMKAALENFAQFPTDKPKWAILGDMFELGESTEVEHHEIAMLAATKNFEKVILTGRHFYDNPADEVFETTENLSQFLEKNPPKGKAILLKGSRGMKLESVIAVL